MALDLTRVAGQVGRMLARLKERRDEHQRHLLSALEALGRSAGTFEQLQKKIDASKTTWLVAGLVEKPDLRYAAPFTPPDFTILAADGSQIDIDRHRSARCYLLNTGSVVLRYGTQPDAVLESQPRLYAEDEDMVIAPPDRKGRGQPVEGNLLGIKRGIEECRRLAELAQGQPVGSQTLALLDGTLILWGLEAYPDFVGDILLHKGFLAYLDEMRKLNQHGKLAMASYISLPRGADVVNALKVALCPHEIINMDRLCPECKTRECDAVAGIADRDIFASVLEPGERSAVFASRSSVVQKSYGDHAVHFFYLRLEDEIARVEIPGWAAKNEGLLNLAHTLILDQCKRGHGYPVALSEAHEQAVVTGIDREDFWQLVDSMLVEERLPVVTSRKDFSKRMRWV
ncbi:MAG: DNA double-strand break repair nuclease NurA [Chloroflexi bacterium]|nr:DNA double-strand break repair nuclease NurA [Chloroflexota bacterium]